MMVFGRESRIRFRAFLLVIILVLHRPVGPVLTFNSFSVAQHFSLQ